MKKIIFFSALMALSLSCKHGISKTTAQDAVTNNFDVKKLPKKLPINSKAMAILKQWPEFNAFETSFDALYRVGNKEDLKLVIEDLIEKQKLLEASTYPKEFDTPQIKSRQKVVKTFFLKAKGNMEYDLDPMEPVLAMVKAYNALRDQFNVTVNNTLDTKLLLDE